ncbi:hypothetical protein J4208_01460 [Candidatus Woesearchaeota archaeon]|nr:hypothetical protein [Candidatus Woesearchaeota archaeon]
MTIRLQDTKEFYHEEADKSLEKCQAAGYQPLFMPQLVDVRINGQDWHCEHIEFITPSIKATGKTKQGNKIVVYAHVPTSVATPKAIKKKNSLSKQSIYGSAAHLSQKEFQGLVDRDGLTDAEGNRIVWVVDHAVLAAAPFCGIPLDQALKHPQTIPFLGGEERAKRYLKEHARAYATDKISIWYTKDENRKDSPLAHLLKLGGSLFGSNHSDCGGMFLGAKNFRSASNEEQWYKIRIRRMIRVEEDYQQEIEESIIVKADSPKRVRLYGEALNNWGSQLKKIEALKDGPIDPNKSISLVGEDFRKSLAKVGFSKKSIEEKIAGIRRAAEREMIRVQENIGGLEVFLKEL